MKSSSRNESSTFGLQDGSYAIAYQEIVIGKFRYFVPEYASHRPAVRKVLKGRFYEPQTHFLVERFYEKVQGSMVHAGCFFGDMLPSFSSQVKGNLYAFEPVLENYILAKLCVEVNQLDNVLLQNCALSDKITNLKIDTFEVNGLHAGGGSQIASSGATCMAVTVDSLSDDNISLIQLDVEGHELSALTGAKETIVRCRPLIAIEDNFQQCKHFLHELNYERVGEIPGLSIWVPQENDLYRGIVRESLAMTPRTRWRKAR